MISPKIEETHSRMMTMYS